MAATNDPLRLFHPLIGEWFAATLGEPTEVQRLAWPAVAAGRHVLVSAPTGTGKTLAAFLWAIDRLVAGEWPGGQVRVLYVSPLKALNTDVRRNLLGPLEEIRGRFDAASATMPEIRVLTRSGDTPAEERARMARRPPEILITTPESLNILLTSRRGREMLGGLATVILDEVHAVVGGKRGTHLIAGVERLVRLSGEFQRLALSATVRPLDRVAEWVGGFEVAGEGSDAAYRRRRVEVVVSRAPKRYDLSVRYPGGAADPDAAAASPDAVWTWVAAELRRPLSRNRSTLVFANSRRMVEKLTRLVNEDEGGEVAYSHHGSLSREVRAVVEDRFKAGELRGIVATNSLELGIDIGDLEESVLVQPPPSVASAVQRIGRAGHRVGETSRGTFLPLVPKDLLGAAVIADAVLEGAIEPVRPVEGALDVLAQEIVSMTAGETWRIDDLYAALRGADPYRDLPRRQFDLVVEMLAGRYAEARIRELRPLVTVDRVDGTLRARPGAARVVYLSGGTIPDRGYFHLRVEDSGALLGELDEEFVWERSVGDTFTLGVQTWRIERITHNDVLVRPARARSAMAPFWRADERDRGFELSERIGVFLEEADRSLDDAGFRSRLADVHRLDPVAADALVRHLAAQKAATGALPHRHRVVAEHVTDPQGKDGAGLVVLHTVWGGRVNRPFAIALQAAWRDRHGMPLEVMHDDECVAVGAPPGTTGRELMSLVDGGSVERLLRAQLESTGFFGARFRAAAGCALLLPREGFRRRTPLWLSRQRAKELLDAVARFEDFPILLEAWRTCLRDEFDLANLGVLLDEVRDGRIEVREARTAAPSPFAAGVSWKRTNELMYEDDTPTAGRSRLRADLLREVVFAEHLRPRLARSLVEAFRAKVQRTHPGYSPREPGELLAWLVERALIPVAEWRELLAAVARDHGVDPTVWVAGLSGKLAALAWRPGDEPRAVAAVESVPRLLRALDRTVEEIELSSALLDRGGAGETEASLSRALDRAGAGGAEDAEVGDLLGDLAADVLRFYGPVARASALGVLDLGPEREAAVLDVLADEQRIVVGQLTDGATEPEVCDAENLERLLRAARAAARPAFEALPPDRLAPFLAAWQGLGGHGAGVEDLQGALERLLCFGAPAEAWEAEILPARLDPYHPAWLDALLAESALMWAGCGRERVAFVLGGERELISGAEEDAGGGQHGDVDAVVPPGPGRFGFEELLTHSGMPSGELANRLWELAWRGDVGNDGFAAVRRGIETGFRPAEPEPGGARPRGRRMRFERWKGSRPFLGSWYRVPPSEQPADALGEEELAKDRARVVLDRYGVVFRELLERELPALQWPRVFRALRLMELGGEVVGGQFFLGVPGLQFATHEALRRLRDEPLQDAVWWVNAADPASPCGLALDGLGAELPRRVATSHVVLHGARVVLVSDRRARRLEIRVAPDHPSLADYLSVIKVLLTRAAMPMRAVVVETINGDPAAASPYRGVFDALFHTVRDAGSLRLMRRY
ncbi:MAG TPA: DEAD/DEAH box helicase [Thermoanaerobaculaceae bacterium]|nr:DEAD/DEAH box helicase [Thermoanaerobaculaceae bacterium]